jgi:hypothetical protein
LGTRWTQQKGDRGQVEGLPGQKYIVQRDLESCPLPSLVGKGQLVATFSHFLLMTSKRKSRERSVCALPTLEEVQVLGQKPTATRLSKA